MVAVVAQQQIQRRGFETKQEGVNLSHAANLPEEQGRAEDGQRAERKNFIAPEIRDAVHG